MKQPGRAEEGIRQALEYAFHTGVPLVALTDGKTWSFYLPAEQGSYEDRRVYKLDLFERPPAEAAAALHRYLARSLVESGEALETARKEYRSRNRRAQARTAIPEAWREMVEKGDEFLVDHLAKAVESKVGVRPEDDEVAEFLAALGKATFTEAPRGSRSHTDLTTVAVRQPPMTESSRRGNLVLSGKKHSYSNAKDAMVIVLRELAKADAFFFLSAVRSIPTCRGEKDATSLGLQRNFILIGRTCVIAVKDCPAGGW